MSNNYSDNPFVNLFNELEKKLTKAKNHYIATVSSVSDSGISITVDGDTGGAKMYTCNRGENFSPGDRVLVAKESGTYVVICKIGKPGKLVKKTSAMTQSVGVDSDGGLWTTPAKGYRLPVANSTTLGGVMPVNKTSGIEVGIDNNGRLWADLPVATSTTRGGVKPDTKTDAMTQPVGIDNSGKLWTTPPGAAKVTKLYSSTTSTSPYTVTLSSSGTLAPNTFSSYNNIGLGTSDYWFGDCYLGGYSNTRIGNDTYYSRIGFFGNAPIKQPTLSTYSSNMGYTSATESNYLTILNNVVGILENYGLIG